MPVVVNIYSGIYPPDTGGPAKFAEYFANFLSSQGYLTRVFAYCDQKSLVSDGVIKVSRKIPPPIRQIHMIFRILTKYKRSSLNLVNGCFAEIAVARFFLKFKYVTKVPGDIVWERAKNKSWTESNIDQFQFESLRLSLRILRLLFVYSLKKSNHIIVPSSHLKKLCIGWGILESKIEVIENSISVEDFNPDNSGLNFDLVTVSRLVTWKRIQEIISVAAETGKSLLVIGDGPEMNNLKKFSIICNANVTFLGQVDSHDIPNYLKAARIFISNSSYEGGSHAIMEAMSCGLLVIGSENTGTKETLIHLRTGLLCGPNSGLTLETAIELAESNPALVSKLRLGAREAALSRFDMNKNFLKILRMLK